MKHPLLLCLLFSFAFSASAREWFVRQSAPDASGDGSADHPLRTINAAAQLAQPGDIVTVGSGIYHEWVSPARAGSANVPIIYRSVPKHAAIIRGTDVLDANWQPVADSPGVFTAPLPQKAFVFGNPFVRPPEPSNKKRLKGWRPTRNALVFYKDQPLTQVVTRQELTKIPDSWLASDDANQLLVHLNDHTAPAPGTIEITTRDRIFAPHRRGLSYINVEGFVFERCATRPGFPQLGALSTRSGHHWIIRNNIVRQTTARGIDCGSETWNPPELIATEKDDQHILIAYDNLVEGNLCADNAEGGIAAWNATRVRIVGNTIRDNCAAVLDAEHSLVDFEAAGIKVHAFRDGLIERNLVENNASFGIWLDDGWENSRVTRNVCIANHGSGIFVELGFGPVLVDHNLCAASALLDPPYFGDGIYTHDASGITITHNTFIDNARFGVHQTVVTERTYGPKRLAEASHENITANLFYGNKTGAIDLPLLSPRAHDNVSDFNAVEPGAKFGIHGNAGRIPISMIQHECRDRLQVADIPKEQWPDLSDPKKLPNLSLAAWQAVMQMDEHSTTLSANIHLHLDPRTKTLQIDLPKADPILTTPAGPADDFDLLGQPIKPNPIAGAIQHLKAGSQTVSVWPLPPVTQ